jgi:hypothetical protein
MEYKPLSQTQDPRLIIKDAPEVIIVDVNMECESYNFILETIHKLLGKYVYIYEVSDMNLNFSEYSSSLVISNPTVTFIGLVSRPDLYSGWITQKIKTRVVTKPEIGIRFSKLIRNNESLLLGPEDLRGVSYDELLRYIESLDRFSWLIEESINRS